MTQVNPKSFVSQFSEALAISLVIASLIAFGALTVKNFHRLLNDRLQVRQTNQVLLTIEEIESAIVSSETGQRGFIITGEEPYMQPYQDSVESVKRIVSKIEELTQDNPQQKQRVSDLKGHIREKLDELEGAITVRRAQGVDAAMQAVKTDVGYRTLDDVREVLQEMRDAERKLLVTREAKAQRSYRVGVISTVLTTVVGLLLLGGVLYLIQRNRGRAARAAATLAESAMQRENYFRDLADASPAMIWITDREHMCTFVSRRWYETTGQSKEGGMGLGWTDVTHPDDHRRATQTFMDAVNKRDPFTCEYRLRMADGRYRWVLDVGRPRFDECGEFTGYIGNVIDVHEKWTAEQELRTSESRLRLAADSTGFGTYDFDASLGTSIWSEQLYHIVGLPVGMPIDRSTFASILYPKDLEIFEQHVEAVLSNNREDDFCMEFRIIRSDGEIRWVIDSGRSMRELPDRCGPVMRVVGTIQDITQRKSFEQSLQLARRTAEAASRSRGEFLANMSHEIRTPMAAILGHADILNDHLIDPDNRQAVETIRRNGKFLLEIINDILVPV